MTELSPDERKFLAAARSEWGPSAPVTRPSSSAIRRRLQEKPWLARSGTMPSTTRLGLAFSGLGVCVVAVVLASKLLVVTPASVEDASSPSMPVATERASESPPMPSVNIDSLPDAPASEGAVRQGKTPKAKPSPIRPVDTSTRTTVEDDPLAYELQLIRSAQQALRDGEPARALPMLATHASRFPSGTLRDERMMLQVLARCSLGEVAAAREIKVELERLSPDSSHLQRLANSCAR